MSDQPPNPPRKRKDRKLTMRVPKYANIPKDCAFTHEQILEMNRFHDEQLIQPPSWLVPAPAWFNKFPDDEDEEAFKIQCHHEALDKQRITQQLENQIAHQQKLEAMKAKDNPPTNQQNDQTGK